MCKYCVHLTWGELKHKKSYTNPCMRGLVIVNRWDDQFDRRNTIFNHKLFDSLEIKKGEEEETFT